MEHMWHKFHSVSTSIHTKVHRCGHTMLYDHVRSMAHGMYDPIHSNPISNRNTACIGCDVNDRTTCSLLRLRVNRTILTLIITAWGSMLPVWQKITQCIHTFSQVFEGHCLTPSVIPKLVLGRVLKNFQLPALADVACKASMPSFLSSSPAPPDMYTFRQRFWQTQCQPPDRLPISRQYLDYYDCNANTFSTNMWIQNNVWHTTARMVGLLWQSGQICLSAGTTRIDAYLPSALASDIVSEFLSLHGEDQLGLFR